MKLSPYGLRREFKRFKLSTILVILLLLTGCGSREAANQIAPSTRDVWLPAIDENVGQPNAIRVVSPDDIWVAGKTGAHIVNGRATEPARGLVAHWDGKDWKVVFTIGDGSGDHIFNDIDVVNANDVWAVGRHTRTEGTKTIYDPLIVHWDGSRWDTVHLPAWSKELGELRTVEVLAPDDIWVGGSRLIHWNGKEWSQVNLAVSDFAISDFSATSESDVWAAAGNKIFHWNGKEWSESYEGEDRGSGQMALPFQFASIEATSANDAWAVSGIDIPTNCGGRFDYLYHWDGVTWTQVEEIGTMPGPCGGGYIISSLSALTADNVWLMEGFIEGRTLKHWDGTVWTEFSCPEQGSAVTNMRGHPKQFINKILSMDKTNVWLLGSYSFPNDGPTMAFTKDWSSRGWIMQAYLGECLPPTLTPFPKWYLPPTPIPTITPTHDPNVPETVPTVPLPVPSGGVPVQTGVVPVSP